MPPKPPHEDTSLRSRLFLWAMAIHVVGYCVALVAWHVGALMVIGGFAVAMLSTIGSPGGGNGPHTPTVE